MTTHYIIKFNNNIETFDGFVELTKKNNIPVLNVRTEKDSSNKLNQTLLCKFMTNNFAKFTFDDINSTLHLEYKDAYSATIYNNTIIFDDSSMSAYSDFKKTFTEYLNSKYETEYYPSGREWYVGEVLYKKGVDEVVVERVPHGTGTFYYDLPSHKIKYNGDFENGMYDGSGTFYSMDGKMSIQCNNISNGIPTQKGKLHINFNNKKETHELQFNDIWEKFSLATKEERKEYVNSCDFVLFIAKLYWKDDTTMEELIFQDKPLGEQYTELWKIMKNQETQLENINTTNNILNTNTITINTNIWFYAMLIIFVNILNSVLWFK